MDIKNIILILSEEWKKCGIEAGDMVMVHSASKPLITKINNDFGIKITPKEILDSLKKAVGIEGTLLFPLFNFTDWTQNQKFDINNTHSEMGVLSELARLDENSVRTGHPIYSFAVIGKKSYLFNKIDNESGYGSNSPFAVLKNNNGKIAVLALPDQTSMTSYHFVEEACKVNYRFHKSFKGEYTDSEGVISEKTYTLFVRNTDMGVQTDVNRMMERLWSKSLYKGYEFDKGFLMRTIEMVKLYDETKKVIEAGEAINYLYSIEM